MIKKILFIVGIVAIGTSSYNAQITKFSFESGEGFTTGNIHGQKGWNTWYSVLNNNLASIIETSEKKYINSVNVVSFGSEAYGGIDHDLTSLVKGQDIDISFDYKFEKVGGSDYYITIYNDDTYDNITSEIYINFEDGKFYYTDSGNDFKTGPQLEADKWYNFNVIIKKSDNTIQYLVDGKKVYSGALGEFKNAAIIDFLFDDYDGGFTFDNVIIKDLEYLSTINLSKNDGIHIYPNPTVDIINFNTDEKIVDISIFDAQGRLVKSISNPSNSINVEDLEIGNYVLNIKTENSNVSKKVIKK